jgi:hypothetical protein
MGTSKGDSAGNGNLSRFRKSCQEGRSLAVTFYAAELMSKLFSFKGFNRRKFSGYVRLKSQTT